MISSIIFVIALALAGGFFTKSVLRIRRNIFLGRDEDLSDRKSERWSLMAKVALGQSKMTARPVAGILHILVYVGFVIINIEVLEIVIDGIFNTHRVFSFMGSFYDLLIGSFEVLAFLVLVSCIVFLVRRNILKIKRFHLKEMKKWPTQDANIILIAEVFLMGAFLKMNAADAILQVRGVEHYVQAGSFPISQFIVPFMENWETATLIVFERSMWWVHILGIFLFLNFLPYSKHFHIMLAFPNVFYANLNPKGRFNNLASVKKEVEMMMDPNADPFAAPPADETAEVMRFGAKDVTDLSWKQLMNAYSCTECGRCSSVCPANLTGKELSPRKIMMDTRDRLEIVGENVSKHGKDYDDGKSLLRDHISEEEVLACTSCNACVDACPINIDPLSIIVDLRRYLIMEESKAPNEWNGFFTNIENNGAPWQFSPSDRLNWKDEN